MLTQPLDDSAVIHVGGNTSALFCQNGNNSASEGWTFFPLVKCLFCILRRGPNATRSKIKFACLGDPEMWHLADHQSSFFFGSKCPPIFKSENLKLLNCKSVAQKLSKTYGTHPAQQANLAPLFSDHWASLLIWCSCRTCQVLFELRWEKMTPTNEECKVHKQNKQDLSTLRCVTNPCHGSTSASVQSYFVQVVS